MSNSVQPVGSKASHLVPGCRSTRFSFVSPPPVFSSLARTSMTWSVTLPGMPRGEAAVDAGGPLLSVGAVSTVLRQSGCGSSASKDELNSRAGRPAGGCGQRDGGRLGRHHQQGSGRRPGLTAWNSSVPRLWCWAASRAFPPAEAAWTTLSSAMRRHQ